MYGFKSATHTMAPSLVEPGCSTGFLGYGNGALLEDLCLGGDVGDSHASPDHVELGGTLPVQVGPHTLTTGQLNALADYVGSPDELAAMDPLALQRALVLIAKEPLTPDEEAELLAIFPRYDELSLNNENHFGASNPDLCAPTGDGGPTNRSQSAGWLASALSVAANAGRAKDAAGLQEALAMAAFGGHFIADAFSSGHLFNKGDVMARAGQGLADAGAMEQGVLYASAALRIHREGADTLSHWRERWLGVALTDNPVRAETLATLLAATGTLLTDTFLNGVVLAIHNALSEQGVEVTDGEATWTMYGDEHMDPVSEARASALIEHTYAMVQAAYANPDAVPKVDDVMARLPVPVEREETRVAAMIERACTVQDGGMEDAVVAGALDQLDAILDQAGARIPGLTFVRVDGPAPGGPKPDGPGGGTLPAWALPLDPPDAGAHAIA